MSISTCNHMYIPCFILRHKRFPSVSWRSNMCFKSVLEALNINVEAFFPLPLVNLETLNRFEARQKAH
ncbi:unnamed protein product [Rhizophagus irregularis]|uniref:Uncharacterized protein n=1 Tax=Rhizophagus irregularis TaxID=588596 RepID=A0A915ZSG0_9GLOM|nr:unnamed protein product [Rhizophagus irregularis]CAB5386323.1 unnamed protein product [Rhizophagus irregularis]